MGVSKYGSLTSTLSLIQNLHGQTIVTGLPAGLTRVLVRVPVRSDHRTHTVLLQSATLRTLALGLVSNHQTDLRGHCAVKLITGTYKDNRKSQLISQSGPTKIMGNHS